METGVGLKGAASSSSLEGLDGTLEGEQRSSPSSKAKQHGARRVPAPLPVLSPALVVMRNPSLLPVGELMAKDTLGLFHGVEAEASKEEEAASPKECWALSCSKKSARSLLYPPLRISLATEILPPGASLPLDKDSNFLKFQGSAYGTELSQQDKKLPEPIPVGPRLLIRNEEFQDLEEFDPYLLLTNHRAFQVPGEILASFHGWFLVLEDYLVYFLDPRTEDVIMFPPPPPNGFPPNIVAGSFIGLPGQNCTVVFVGVLDIEDIFIIVYMDGVWNGNVYPYANGGINSLIVHDGMIWWLDDQANLYVLHGDLEDNQINSYEVVNPHVCLVSYAGRLYIIDTQPEAPLLFRVLYDEALDDIEFSEVDEMGTDYFVIGGQAGFALPSPEDQYGNRIFIGLPPDSDCQRYSTNNGMLEVIKTCRPGGNHNNCNGRWFS